jgi:signal recognition particle subunit SRP54
MKAEPKGGFQSIFGIFSGKLLTSKAPIDDDTITKVLKEIETCLVKGDTSAKLARQFSEGVKASLSESKVTNLTGKHKVDAVKCQVIKGLQKLLTPSTSGVQDLNSGVDRTSLGASGEEWEPIREQTNIVMFVGLQGSGKTTSVMKYANYYKKKGLKVACICADTFRCGAYDQLKQNCTKIKVPFFGSYSERSPEVVVEDGISVFVEDNFELIIIDTAGRHSQADDLKDEMQKIIKVAQPNHTIMVLDSSIGQAAHGQAVFFKQFGVDSLILTKMDNTNVKGGGALVAVAATNSPVRFIGTGESMDDFEPFDPKSYVQRLLGFGDVKRLMEKITDTESSLGAVGDKLTRKMIGNGKFTFGDFIEMIRFLLDLSAGKMSNITSLIPGFQKLIKSTTSDRKNKGTKSAEEMDEEFEKKMKKSIFICDSMHHTELNNNDEFLLSNNSRITRIARGSGTTEDDVKKMIQMFTPFKEVLETMKKLPKGTQEMLKSGKLSATNETQEDIMNTMMMSMSKKMARNPGSRQLMKTMMKQMMPGKK